MTTFMQKLAEKFLGLSPTPNIRYCTWSLLNYDRLDSYTHKEAYESSAELLVLKDDGQVYVSTPIIVDNTYRGSRKPDVITSNCK